MTPIPEPPANLEFQEHLKTLHRMTLELAQLENLDAVYRRGVEFGLAQLGFDRLAIFRLGSSAEHLIGTYGTAPDGILRDERDFHAIQNNITDEQWQELLLDKQQVMLYEDQPLVDYDGAIGQGWHAVAIMWDGEQAIGMIPVDNFVHHRPPRPYEKELISLYSAAMAHLITQHESQDELHASQQRYRGLFQDVPVGLLEYDYSAVKSHIDALETQGISDFRAYFHEHPKVVAACGELIELIDANKMALDLSRVSSTAELTAVIAQRRVNEDYVLLRDILLPLIEGGTLLDTERKIRYIETGEEIDISLQVKIAPGSEENWSRILIAMSDITKQKRAEAERIAHEKLRLAYEQEQELNTLKNDLLRVISHELRTPIAIISTAAAIIEEFSAALTDSERRAEFNKIGAQVDHLRDILDDVSLVVKTHTGHVLNKPFPLNVPALCTNLIDEIRPTLGAGTTLTFRSEGELDKVYTDPKLLRHILSNLLTNAIKYSPDGGLVSLEVIAEPSQICYIVRDEGIGISDKDQVHLFEAYYRGNNVKQIGGTGLGLKIVKDFVDLCNGYIEVESEIGKGSTFTVYLPTEADENLPKT